ncbi:hypothetical protein M2347_000648 [Chryseobacterium sp. H1D6B]|nr:hypothetical protein [Chryseobacterium sp. H1D6B]
MEIYDYSFIIKLTVSFVLLMLAILGFYLIIRKKSYKSGFWCYSHDFPRSRKYWNKKQKM